MTKKRFKPEIRKESIIAAALDLAEDTHYREVTRDQIGRRIGVTGTAVMYHFGTMQQLRREVMRAAVKQERLQVIAQGLTCNDVHADRASEALQLRAVAACVKC